MAVLTLFATLWPQLPIAWQVEQATLDFRYQRFNPGSRPSPRIVVLNIDDHSLRNLSQLYGRWPWPRHIYKEVIEFLSVGEPSAILFDVLFTESMKEGKDDALLAEVSKVVPSVSHAMAFMAEPSEQREDHMPLAEDFRLKFSLPVANGGLYPLTRHRDYQIPNPAFYNKVHHYHSVTVDLDRDGKLRRVPLLAKYGDHFFPSLALAGVLATLNNPTVHWEQGELVIQPQDRQAFRVPVDASGAMPLHFYPLDHSPQTISFDEVITSHARLQRGEVNDPAELKVNPFDFKNKVVIIGGSASGLQDLKATPIHQSYPGALAQATAISNVLKHDHLTIMGPTAALFFTILLLAAVYAGLCLLPTLALQVAVPFVCLFLYNLMAISLFRNFEVALPMGMPNLLALTALFDGLAYLILVEGGEKRKMKSTLSKYVSPIVTERIMDSGLDPHAEIGQHRELTILFSDVRGFTSISEALPPQQIVECLNTYLSRMNEIIFEHLGTVDKFIGDGLMAFWGAPLEDDLHAVHSVQCALGMLKEMRKLKGRLRTQYQAPFDLEIGIGVNTGKVIVGNIGSERRLSYTVIGDNVNLASRIESITKFYRVPLLLGETTYEAVKNHITCRLVDKVQVKGKQQSVKIYHALSTANDESNPADLALKEEFERSWTAYEVGDFTRARTGFEKLLAQFPNDGPVQIYLDRLDEFKINPPTEWRGVHVLQSK